MANETIEKYLHDRLSPVERNAFEKALRQDSSLVAQVEQEKDLRIAVDLMARLKKKEELEGIQQNFNIPRSGRLVFRIAAAVTLLLVLGGYWMLNRTYSNEALLAGFTEPYQMDLTNRGGDYESILMNATAAYRAGQYEMALGEFSKLPEDLDENPLVQVFTGNCQLELGRFDQAVNTFSRISQDSELYGETARWYLALSYLGMSDEENAKNTLRQIREGAYNYSKARQLLSRLNSPLRKLPGI